MANVPFSLRLDADIKTRLKQEAELLKRSESFVATTAIKNYLSAREQKRNAIDAAIAQAEQGDFISSRAMGAWVDSWGTDNERALPEIDTTIK
jgi:predicted transcriptional regulator